MASSTKVKCQANHGPFNPSSAYLELNSVALQQLLGSFFKNPLIAEQLDSLYGLQRELRDVLLAAPVALRVDALEAGRFQASVQARLMRQLVKPTGSSEVLILSLEPFCSVVLNGSITPF